MVLETITPARGREPELVGCDASPVAFQQRLEEWCRTLPRSVGARRPDPAQACRRGAYVAEFVHGWRHPSSWLSIGDSWLGGHRCAGACIPCSVP